MAELGRSAWIPDGMGGAGGKSLDLCPIELRSHLICSPRQVTSPVGLSFLICKMSNTATEFIKLDIVSIFTVFVCLGYSNERAQNRVLNQQKFISQS